MRRDDLQHGTNAAYVQGCVSEITLAYLSISFGVADPITLAFNTVPDTVCWLRDARSAQDLLSPKTIAGTLIPFPRGVLYQEMQLPSRCRNACRTPDQGPRTGPSGPLRIPAEQEDQPRQGQPCGGGGVRRLWG